MIPPVSLKETPKAFDLSSLCRQAGQAPANLYSSFISQSTRVLKAKTEAMEICEGSGESLWNCRLGCREEESEVFLSPFTLPMLGVLMPFSTLTYKGPTIRGTTKETESPLLLLDQVSIKPTLLPAAPQESSAELVATVTLIIKDV